MGFGFCFYLVMRGDDACSSATARTNCGKRRRDVMELRVGEDRFLVYDWLSSSRTYTHVPRTERAAFLYTQVPPLLEEV